MTAKEYLKRIELLDIMIRQREEQLNSLRETAGGAAAIRYDKLNVQMSVSPDMMERNVIKLLDLEEKIFADKVRLESLKNEIVEQIQSLDDNRYVDVLFRRYVRFQKFEQIALDMSYDYVYIRELHGEALGAFEQAHKNILHNLTKQSDNM